MPTASISVRTVQQGLTYWSEVEAADVTDAPSPGRIDGRWGTRTHEALRAYVVATRPGRLNAARVLAPLRATPARATEIQLEEFFVARLHTHALLHQNGRRPDRPGRRPDRTDEPEDEDEPSRPTPTPRTPTPTPRTPAPEEGKPAPAQGIAKNRDARQNDPPTPSRRSSGSGSAIPILGGFALVAVTLLGAAAISKKKRKQRRQRQRPTPERQSEEAPE